MRYNRGLIQSCFVLLVLLKSRYRIVKRRNSSNDDWWNQNPRKGPFVWLPKEGVRKRHWNCTAPQRQVSLLFLWNFWKRTIIMYYLSWLLMHSTVFVFDNRKWNNHGTLRHWLLISRSSIRIVCLESFQEIPAPCIRED